MRSRVDGGSRKLVERFLRVAALVALAYALWASLAPSARDEGGRSAARAVLVDSLARWTADPGADSLHVVLDRSPDRVARAWLVALRRSGAHVGWSVSGALPAIALSVEPPSAPGGGARALIAAPPGARVPLADGLTLVDTVRAASPVSEVRTVALHGAAAATLGGESARTAMLDTIAWRRALVLGSAGWEAKFVIAALEERGWSVAARLRVAPGVEVTQGSAVLDTARVGVVIALDTTADRDAARIARFVRDGGGLVIAGSAARSAALAPLAVGRAGARVPPASVAFADTAPRRALGFLSIGALARGAVPLEMRDGYVAAAARRMEVGRVVQVGYDETWRWRLAGSDDAPEAHRAWWSAVVGSAAHRAARPVAVDSTALDPAPFAATVAALGVPTAPISAERGPLPARGLRPWMLVLILAALLGEWTSRRIRGVP
jgi:hypothetical protein